METFKLPDGGITRSQTRYIREWRRLRKNLCAALDCEPGGFDPHVSLKPRGNTQASYSQIPLWLALRIQDALLNGPINLRPVRKTRA